MKRALSVFAAAILGVLSQPIHAQDATPQLDQTYIRAGKAVRDLARMMDCLMERQPDLARKLFEHRYDSPEYNRVKTEFLEGAPSCLFLTSQLTTTDLMGLGAVAERLISIDGPLRVVDPRHVPNDLRGGSYTWSWRTLTDATKAQQQAMGHCLVARHGAEVERLLATRQSSRQERAVFNSIGAQLTDCIPAGEIVRLSPEYLRKAIAVAYYLAAKSSRASAFWTGEPSSRRDSGRLSG